jgi:hypothetical protein
MSWIPFALCDLRVSASYIRIVKTLQMPQRNGVEDRDYSLNLDPSLQLQHTLAAMLPCAQF